MALPAPNPYQRLPADNRSVGNRMEQKPPRRIPVAQNATEERIMGRYLLLWLLGIPLPILVLIWVFGGLH